MNRQFSSPSLERPKEGYEFQFVYIFEWTQDILKKLADLRGIPFDPFIVSSGDLYVLSGDVDVDTLTNLCRIKLDTRSKKVLKCSANVSRLDKGDSTRYADVFLLLLANGITHVPPDLTSATIMVQMLANKERDLMRHLASEYSIYRTPEPINNHSLTSLWDASVRLQTRIRELSALVTKCDSMSEEKKGVAITDVYKQHCTIPASVDFGTVAIEQTKYLE